MHSRFLVAVVLFVVGVGCTPRIRIEWSRPARFVLPVEQPLAVNVEADGAAPTANNVIDAMIDIGQGQLLNKWLAVLPVRNELDAQLRRAGHNVVEGGSAAVMVRVRPTRWSYKTNKKGSGSGKLEARIEVIDPRNPAAQPLFSDGYWATAGSGKLGEPEAMARASRALARAFLATLQPSRISAEVELDDSDPITEPGIALCKDGQFEAAYLAFSDAATRAPQSAPVLYDLAVLAEARGEYDLAESMLTRATGLEPKALYFSALERVRRAREDADAMNGT
jgi:tetratricopeptide (TPR) repeat protein